MAGKLINPFKPAEKKAKHLKIGIYGTYGVGKTYLALSFPNPAVIDLEGGTDLYSDRFKFNVMDTKSFAEVMTAINFLEHGEHDFKTLVIDPITTVYEALQSGRLEFKASKSESLDKVISGEDKTDFNYKDWGDIKRHYKTFMTKLVNLDMHVVLVGRVKDMYDKKGADLVKVGVTIDAEKSTLYAPDICIRLETNKAGKRIATFEKDRSGHFKLGQTVENISFDNFKPILERFSTGNTQVIHQEETEAEKKDAAFFQQQDQPKAHNGNGKPYAEQQTVNGDTDNQVAFTEDLKRFKPTLETLNELFVALNIDGIDESMYLNYLYDKYRLKDILILADDQIREQVVILRNLKGNAENKAKFKEFLLGLHVAAN